MLFIIKIEADLHVHSISSGHAYSTVDELTKAAAAKGLKLIALTDHGPNLPGGPHPYHFGNLRILPDFLHGVRLLKGIEANILDEGKLDLPQERLETLDFVTAGLHEDTGHHLSSKEEYTRAIIKAMENPLVKMITHPVNLNFPVDLRKIVEAAKENRVILELNAGSYHSKKGGFRGNKSWSIKLARLAKQYAVPISLNSDAHFHLEVGDIASLQDIVAEAGLTEQEVINTSMERILNYISNPEYSQKKTG